MQIAEVRISDHDFGKRLKDMRVWLDGNQFAPSAFTYFYLDPGMMVRVSFHLDDEAAAFARQFGGSLIHANDAAAHAAEQLAPA